MSVVKLKYKPLDVQKININVGKELGVVVASKDKN